MTASGVRWPVVLSALCGGAAASMQIGKASAAIPLLRSEFALTLTEASLYLALFSLGAALLGVPLGIAARRFGVLRAGILGLLLIAGASLTAAMIDSWPVILACRAVESLGLPLVVTTMPALVQAAAGPERRQLVGGIWAAWLPLGVALALFLSMSMAGHASGRRDLFLWCGVVPLLAIGGLLLSRPAAPAATKSARSGRLKADVWMMAGAFLLFSGVNLIVTGFLPSIAEADLGLGQRYAALYGGFAALLIIAGNMLAVVCLTRGMSTRRLLALGFLGMGFCSALFLLSSLPVWSRVVGGTGFQICVGIVPGVLWAKVPLLVQRSGRSAPFIASLYYQAGGIGQVAGPLLAAAAVDVTGTWTGSLGLIGPCCFLGVCLALLLKDREGAAAVPELQGRLNHRGD
ncbi:CynX/NimT family MFS transporter [Rhizobium sp. SGZ-381]|uniref:MFS transporter n=1 Tax=Rhizobium sp. SGZ-381 TaxID=3342800 RepID=UPI00366F1C0E